MNDKAPEDRSPQPERSGPPIDPRERGKQRSPADRIPSLKGKGSAEPTRKARRVPRPGEDPGQTVRRPRVDIPEHTTDTEVEISGSSGLVVPWWGFVIVILAVAAITCGMWYLVLANRGDLSTSIGPTPTPIFVVITATPTLGPAEGGEEEQPPTPTPTEEVPSTNTPPPTVSSTITIGSQVQITGTEGTGLSVRQGPGVEYTYFFVADDGDRFVIEDGPREADGYIWWYIADPNDPDRAGWAAQNWMEIATSP